MEFDILKTTAHQSILVTTALLGELPLEEAKSDLVTMKAGSADPFEPGMSLVTFTVVDTDGEEYYYAQPVQHARLYSLATQMATVVEFARANDVDVQEIRNELHLDACSAHTANNPLVDKFVDWYKTHEAPALNEA